MPRIPRPVLAGLAALTVLRLLVAAWIPPGDDETFYWEWSRHLAAGYVDHPPAIAFLIWAATRLWGSTPFALHSISVLLSLATSLVLWVLAQEVLGSEAGATWSVIVFNAIPVFSAGALLAAPDAPLGLCWVMTLLWTWRAGRGAQARPWLAAGAWLGLALDSKYTAAVIPCSIALWLAASPSNRRWLGRPAPYLGLALALAIFTPVVWWNATHRWTSFALTFVGRPSWSEGGNFPVFLMLQFLYLAPLMFPALLWALLTACRRGLWAPAGRPRHRREGERPAFAMRALSSLPPGLASCGGEEESMPRLRGGDDRWLFLAAAAVPLIIGMFAASALGHVKGHWAAPGYITGAIALAGIATERPWRVRAAPWRGAAILTLGTTVVATALVYTLPVLAPLFLPPALDPTVDYYAWPQAAHQIVEVARRDALRPFFITTDSYQVMAQFDFATGGRYPSTTIIGTDQYGIWTRWAGLRGRDGLFIQDSRSPPAVDLHKTCRSLDVEPAVTLVRRGVAVRTLGLIWCRDFSGHPIRPVRPARHGSPGPGERWVTSASSSSAAAAARGRRE